MERIRAGELKHLVSIDRPVASQDTSGEELISFVEAGKAKASIEPLSGRERLQAMQITATTDTRIRMYWSALVSEMNAKWRIRYLDVIYNIQSIAHIELGHREVEIMASSGGNQG